MRIVYGLAVFDEIVEIAGYLANDNTDAAARFIDRCDESFKLIGRTPNIGVIRDFRSIELTDVRMWRVKDFENYLIFYRVEATNVRILHVVHAARNYPFLFETKE